MFTQKRKGMDLTTDWRVGFVDGEGCFYLRRSRSKHSRLGFAPSVGFQITQSERDAKVLEACKAFFGCGTVRAKARAAGVLDYRVHGLADHAERIVPFFEKHALKTSKRQAFRTYRQAVRTLWERKQAKQPRDAECLRKLVDLGLTRNLRERNLKVAENFRRIRKELEEKIYLDSLEDRVQRLAKAIRETERNSLPSKFWPARKA